MQVPANYWTAKGKEIACNLCPIGCVVSENKSGVCRFRSNIGGNFYLTNYASVAELTLEAIEKKPLHHFYPGSKFISLGTNGCNMACTFCQNYEVSQNTYPTKEVSFEDIHKKLIETNALGLCFTYNEPLVWFEYVRDCAKYFKKLNYKIVLNTNGLINKDPLLDLLPLVDALNLDIKAFTDDFYQKVCKAPLQPVLETAKLLHTFGTHFEISHLVIPNLNDTDYLQISDWTIKNLSRSIPLHINAYYPRYLMNEPATPEKLIKNICARLKLNGHKYVYGNNIVDQTHHNTYCYFCKEVLIERNFNNITCHITNGVCNKCDTFNDVIH